MGSRLPTVGEELRRAREQAGLDLADVAAHLRIRSNFLGALEDGHPDALPGITYAIGYVRTYAGFLGLDPDDAVRRFKEEASGLTSKTQLVFPSPAPEGRVPGFSLMLIAAVLAGTAYGGWYWVSEREGGLRDLVPMVPERLAHLIDGSTPTADPAAPSTPPAVPAATAPTPGATTGSYADANPTGSPVSGTRSSGTADTSSVPEIVPGRPAIVDGPVPPAPTVTAANPNAEPRPAAPTVAPAAPAIVASDPAPARTAATESATAEGATAANEDEAPDVTAAPEPNLPGDAPAETTVAAVPATPAPSASVTPPAPTTTAPTATDAGQGVPAAPRIGGLIGASEAAVPAPSMGASNERVVIRATGDSWVQVRDADGTALFTRVLREGDLYRVPNQGGLRLATGNAGALEILVDGTPAPGLGGFGEVVRNVVLDPARLSAGTAAVR